MIFSRRHFRFGQSMSNKSEPKSFAVRLRELRESEGLSVQQLAQRAGLSRDFVHRLERGEREPSLDAAKRLAAALGRGLEVWD